MQHITVITKTAISVGVSSKYLLTSWKFATCILLLVDFLKDVLESSVVSFQDCVLCAHVQGPLLHDCILEAGMGKSSDALKEIITWHMT